MAPQRRLMILLDHHPMDLSAMAGGEDNEDRAWQMKSAQQHCYWVAPSLAMLVAKVEKAYDEIPEGRNYNYEGVDPRPAETEPSSAPLNLIPRGRDYSWKVVVLDAISQLLFPCPDVNFWDKENMNCRVKITTLPGWPKGMTIVMDMTREGGK